MNNYKYPFEKFEVWQNIRKLTIEIYQITKKFPKHELFGMTNQIRRSAISVSSNIAEGSGRPSRKDQAHFTTMAYSSLLELTNQLILSSDLAFITKNELKNIRVQINHISSQLNLLRNYQYSQEQKK
jgi:four helix bundle protein